jgi:glycosyltransferase involved in cell wall biosynthesis
MRVLALTRYSSLGPSSRIRFHQYVPYLTDCGIDLQVMPLLGNDYIQALYNSKKQSVFSVGMAYINRIGGYMNARSFDLLWIEKELFPWLPAWAESYLTRRRIPFVVDYDDAIFYNYSLNRNPLIRALLGKSIDSVMQHATTVVVGNNYLAEYARRIGARKIEYLPTVVDIDRYPISEKKSKEFRIGWIGTPITAPYLGLVQDALVEVYQQTDARIVLIGAGERDFLPGLEKEKLAWNEASEVANIQSCDVGIMPLPDEPFARGKCGYKLIQYMAAGLPVVASPVGENTRIVEQGKTGFLASSQEEWRQALVSLYEDAGLRKKMGSAGRQRAEKEYTLQITAPRLLDILTTASSHR